MAEMSDCYSTSLNHRNANGSSICNSKSAFLFKKTLMYETVILNCSIHRKKCIDIMNFAEK